MLPRETAQPNLIKNNLRRRRSTDTSLRYKIHKLNGTFHFPFSAATGNRKHRSTGFAVTEDGTNDSFSVKKERLGRRWPYLEVSVDDKSIVHVFEAQYDLSCIKSHIFLAEDAVLRQVIVKVSTWNTQVQYQTITPCYKCIRAVNRIQITINLMNQWF